jgi:hypothetical protein
MSVPTRITLERSASQVFLAFDQDITRVSGILPWDNGFTLTVNAAPTAITVVTKVANGIWFQTASPFLDSDTVQLTYAGSNLVDAATSTDPVAAFAATTAPPFWLNGNLVRSALVPLAAPDTIVITLRDPVASLTNNLKNGLAVTINAVAVSLTSAVVTGTGRTVTIDLTNDVSYNDTVVVTYTSGSGDWYAVEANTAVASFTVTADNASVVGTPESEYPLSTVIAEPLAITDNVVTAKLTVSLNSVDREIASRYAPTFDQGGYYGLPTVNPPTGFFVPSKQLPIRDGQVYAYAFSIPGNPQWASLAAAEWLSTMVARIGISLNTARATDQSITLGNRTITQV